MSNVAGSIASAVGFGGLCFGVLLMVQSDGAQNFAAVLSGAGGAPQATPAYVPAEIPTDRHSVSVTQYIHGMELMSAAGGAVPTGSVEDFVAEHLPAYVEKIECGFLTETLAAHCALERMNHNVQAGGMVGYSALLYYSPVIDPDIAGYDAAADRASRTVDGFADQVIDGTPEALASMRRAAYAAAIAECAALEERNLTCHHGNIALEFKPRTRRMAQYDAEASIELQFGYLSQ